MAAKRKSPSKSKARQRTTAEAIVPEKQPHYAKVVSDLDAKALTAEQFASAVQVQCAVRDAFGGSALNLTDTMRLLNDWLRADPLATQLLVDYWNAKPVTATRCSECGDLAAVNAQGVCADCAKEQEATTTTDDDADLDALFKL